MATISFLVLCSGFISFTSPFPLYPPFSYFSLSSFISLYFLFYLFIYILFPSVCLISFFVSLISSFFFSLSLFHSFLRCSAFTLKFVKRYFMEQKLEQTFDPIKVVYLQEAQTSEVFVSQFHCASYRSRTNPCYSRVCS
jgi:hypothetical protein